MSENTEPRKPWRVLQKISGWRQEFIEDLSYRHTLLRMKIPLDKELPVVSGDWMIEWYESLSSTEKYVLDIMSRMPCIWRGLDKFNEANNVHV